MNISFKNYLTFTSYYVIYRCTTFSAKLRIVN